MVPEYHIGVHRTHCCVLHGCKYGDRDCPVVLKKIEQDYTCEDCEHDGIANMKELREVMDGKITTCPHCGHTLKSTDRAGPASERTEPERPRDD